MATSYYAERNYEDAAAAARSAITRYPAFPLPYRWLAASLGQLGQADGARLALNRAQAISPTILDFYLGGRPPWYGQSLYDHMLEGLVKAGWRN
jgi:tetratricopeptide (TPR) repeat protein